jgi:hypothetical protein
VKLIVGITIKETETAMPSGPRNNPLDLGNRFQPTDNYRAPPPACLAALPKKKNEAE